MKKYLDFIIIGVCACIATYSSYKLFWEEVTINKQGEDQLIGRVVGVENIVKYKPGNLLAWIDARKREELKQNDQLYTHDNSSASINFTEKAIVKVSENTLFKISGSQEYPSINLRDGLIYFKLLDNTKTLKLLYGKNRIEISGKNAELHVESKGDIAKLTVLKGEVIGKNKEVRVSIVKNKSLVLEKNKKIKNISEYIFEKLINLQTPLMNECFYTKNSMSVRFSWEQLLNNKVQLVISKKRDFSKIIHNISLKNETFLDFLDGKYFWKIVAINKNKKLESETRVFRVYKQREIKFISPENDEVFSLNPDGSLVDKIDLKISWTEQENAKYKFVLERSNEIIDKGDLNEPYILINQRKSGTYKFSVKAVYDKRIDDLWTDINFNIKKYDFPNIPERIAPNKKILKIKNNDFIELKWTLDELAKKYYLQVSHDKLFKNIVVDEVLGTNFYQLKKPKGDYYWRVMAIDQLQRKTNFSNVFHFKISDFNHRLILPQDDYSYERKNPNDTISFKFSGEITNRFKYFIEFSNEISFENIQFSDQVLKNEYKLKKPIEGLFYWRINRTNGDEKEFSEIKKIIIKLAPPPKKPKLQLEKLRKKIDIKRIKRKSTFINKMINFFITNAYGQEFQDVILISWPKQDGADNYILQVFKDLKLKNKIIEKKLVSPEYQWINPHVGRFYWRISIIDSWGRKSEFSDPVPLLIVKPEELKRLQVPSLLLPKHRDKISLNDDIKIVTFMWGEIKRAKKYYIKISNNLSFENILVSKTVKKNIFNMNVDDKFIGKKLYWRVWAVDKYGRLVKSKRRSLSFKSLAKKVAKKKKVVPVKKINRDFIFKKIPSQKKVNISGGLSSSYVNYNREDGAVTVKFSGLVFSSAQLSLKYFGKNNKNFFLGKISRVSGTVFDDLGYQDLYSSYSYGSYFDWGFSSPVYATIGVNLNLCSIYERISPEQLRAENQFYGGVVTNIGFQKDLNGKISYNVEARFSIGTILSTEVNTTLTYNVFNNILMMSGLKYEKKFLIGFDSDTTSLDNAKLLVGLKILL